MSNRDLTQFPSLSNDGVERAFNAVTTGISKWGAIALDGDVEFLKPRVKTVRFIPKTVRFSIEIGRFVGQK